VRRPLLIVVGLVAIALAVMLLARPSQRGTEARAHLPFAVGFNESLAQTHRLRDPVAWQRLIDVDARLHHDAGSTVLRTVLHWDATEPAPGRFDFSVPDEIVGRYGRQGVRVLFVVDGTPRWAAGRLAPWRRYVRAVSQRYAGRIVGLDVFNEPNMSGHAIPPSRYARLLCAAYGAADQRVPIGGGALAGGPSLGPYLAAMLRAGAGPCMDAISFHPYPDALDVTARQSLFQRMFATVRALRDRYAPGKPLWVTETGWRAETRAGEQVQAVVLVGILDAVEQMPQHDVRLLLFHTLVGDPLAPGGASYGIVDLVAGGALRKRVAYRVLAQQLR